MRINTLARHRLTYLRDSEEGGGGGDGGQGGNDGGQGGSGPAGGKEFTPISSQEEFDRLFNQRWSREKSKYADYDMHKANSERWEALSRESQTDAERRETELREEAFQEAMSNTVPKVVTVAFKAEAKGVLSDEQIDSLLEDLDLLKYATDDGDPDWDKIQKKVKTFAPEKTNDRSTSRGPGFGQGNGHDQSTKLPGEAGAAEARRRFGPPVGASQS